MTTLNTIATVIGYCAMIGFAGTTLLIGCCAVVIDRRRKRAEELYEATLREERRAYWAGAQLRRAESQRRKGYRRRP